MVLWLAALVRGAVEALLLPPGAPRFRGPPPRGWPDRRRRRREIRAFDIRHADLIVVLSYMAILLSAPVAAMLIHGFS